MKAKITALVGSMRSALPDFRDLHIYGGLTLFGIATFQIIGWAGLAATGAFLVYMGVWRMR